MRYAIPGSLLSCFMFIAGCGDDDQGTVDLLASLDMRAQTGADLSPAVDMRLATATLSYSQSAQVVTSLNTGEVQVAQAATPKLTRADLKAFASQMIADHSQSNTMLDQVTTQAGITKQPNAVSAALDAGAMALVTQISGASVVDPLYATSQVDMHTQALALLDCIVLPGAQNSAWKAWLVSNVRPHVAMHLDEAIAIAGMSNSLDGGTSTCSNICASHNAGAPLTDAVRTAVCIP